LDWALTASARRPAPCTVPHFSQGSTDAQGGQVGRFEARSLNEDRQPAEPIFSRAPSVGVFSRRQRPAPGRATAAAAAAASAEKDCAGEAASETRQLCNQCVAWCICVLKRSGEGESHAPHACALVDSRDCRVAVSHPSDIPWCQARHEEKATATHLNKPQFTENGEGSEEEGEGQGLNGGGEEEEEATAEGG
jgi:hypothetical protein